jgi:hypothetical protein
MNGLLKNAEFAMVEGPAAAGQTVLTTDSVDMLNAEVVTFIIHLGAITSGAALSFKVTQSSDDGGSDGFSDLEGSGITITDDQDDKIVICEVIKPLKRYIRGVLTRGTQNSVLNGIVAIKTGLRNLPATQGTTVSTLSESSAGPAEGTA